MDQVDSESDESFVLSRVQTETQRPLDNEDISQELKSLESERTGFDSLKLS